MIDNFDVSYSSREELLRVAEHIPPHPADQIHLHIFCGIPDFEKIENLLQDVSQRIPHGAGTRH